MPGLAGAAHQLRDEHGLVAPRALLRAAPLVAALGRGGGGGGGGLLRGRRRRLRLPVCGGVCGAVGVGAVAVAVGLRQSPPGGHVGGSLVVNLVLAGLQEQKQRQQSRDDPHLTTKLRFFFF